MNDGDAKCNCKSITLTLFFLFQVFGFTACLLAIVSPTWQYVYLEDGRTEHHHGLWLDCKRDYSNEYGRPREYYEKLYRLEDLQGPFDQFSLPSLMCVYKFDYWIDEEDLYEHGYDENRLQDDAYQHLFLGWKIAALTALTFSLVCALSSLIISVCAFCHRLLVCVSTVIATISVITCIIGNTIFFMYARYQDNNIIKEDDGIYEQYFGWSFYTSLIGNFFLFLAAVLGCVTTSIVMSLGKAKLVKIEIDDSDSNQLLSSGSSDQPFKRSFSMVYKIDSAALRKWEKEAMRSFRRTDFKRANSMPNIKKGQTRNTKSPSFMHSSSDISKAFTEPPHFTTEVQRKSLTTSETQLMDHYTTIVPPGGSAFPGNTTDPIYLPPLPHTNPEDVVYEYVDHNSISLSSSVKMDTLQNRTSPMKPGTTMNIYDKVASIGTPSISSQLIYPVEDSEYLRPKNTTSTTIPAYSQIEKSHYEKTSDEKPTSFGSSPGHRRMPSEDFRLSPISTRGKSTLISPISTFTPTLRPLPPELPAKPAFLKPSPKVEDSSKVGQRLSRTEDQIHINTFEDKNRNIRPLGFPNVANDHVNIFDRSNTTSPASRGSTNDTYALGARTQSNKLLHQVLLNEAVNNSGIKETNLDWPSLPKKNNSRNNSDISLNSKTSSLLGHSYVPSEMDRSLGSSTIVLPNSPSQRFYDYDSEDDRSSVSISKGNTQDGETFV